MAATVIFETSFTISLAANIQQTLFPEKIPEIEGYDIAVFNRWRRQTWWKAPLIGSLVASVVDTAVFFALAFAGTDMDWLKLAAGDLTAKAAMALVLLAPYRAALPHLQTWVPATRQST